MTSDNTRESTNFDKTKPWTLRDILFMQASFFLLGVAVGFGVHWLFTVMYS